MSELPILGENLCESIMSIKLCRFFKKLLVFLFFSYDPQKYRSGLRFLSLLPFFLFFFFFSYDPQKCRSGVTPPFFCFFPLFTSYDLPLSSFKLEISFKTQNSTFLRVAKTTKSSRVVFIIFLSIFFGCLFHKNGRIGTIQKSTPRLKGLSKGSFRDV